MRVGAGFSSCCLQQWAALLLAGLAERVAGQAATRKPHRPATAAPLPSPPTWMSPIWSGKPGRVRPLLSSTYRKPCGGRGGRNARKGCRGEESLCASESAVCPHASHHRRKLLRKHQTDAPGPIPMASTGQPPACRRPSPGSTRNNAGHPRHTVELISSPWMCPG